MAIRRLKSSSFSSFRLLVLLFVLLEVWPSLSSSPFRAEQHVWMTEEREKCRRGPDNDEGTQAEQTGNLLVQEESNSSTRNTKG